MVGAAGAGEAAWVEVTTEGEGKVGLAAAAAVCLFPSPCSDPVHRRICTKALLDRF